MPDPDKTPKPTRQPYDPLEGIRDKRHEERRVLDPRTGKLIVVRPDPPLEPEFT